MAVQANRNRDSFSFLLRCPNRARPFVEWLQEVKNTNMKPLNAFPIQETLLMPANEPIQTPQPADSANISAGVNAPSRKAVVIGWIIGILPILMLAMSAAMKFTQPKEVVQGFEHLGWPLKLAMPLGVVELACSILYLIPRTAALGAILLTGYLGGAMATTLRVGDSIVIALIMGILLWGGVFLRDPRLRSLIPLRR
jgi:hypothetical protein